MKVTILRRQPNRSKLVACDGCAGGAIHDTTPKETKAVQIFPHGTFDLCEECIAAFREDRR